MCRVLGVSASGYYAWRGRGRSRRAQRDEELRGTVRTIHKGSGGTYGVPRVHAQLHRRGCPVSRKRVARLMREAGLAGVSRRRSTRTTRREPGHRAAPDRVERQFQADAPNCIWVADITYVPTWTGFVYLVKRRQSLFVRDPPPASTSRTGCATSEYSSGSMSTVSRRGPAALFESMERK